MRRAFHSLRGPKGFHLQIVDHDNFLTVKASEKQFMSLSGEERKEAVQYMIRVKKALEDNGAIVLLVREGGKEA
jgi:DNA primase catalytic subunit